MIMYTVILGHFFWLKKRDEGDRLALTRVMMQNYYNYITIIVIIITTCTYNILLYMMRVVIMLSMEGKNDTNHLIFSFQSATC